MATRKRVNMKPTKIEHTEDVESSVKDNKSNGLNNLGKSNSKSDKKQQKRIVKTKLPENLLTRIYHIAEYIKYDINKLIDIYKKQLNIKVSDVDYSYHRYERISVLKSMLVDIDKAYANTTEFLADNDTINARYTVRKNAASLHYKRVYINTLLKYLNYSDRSLVSLTRAVTYYFNSDEYLKDFRERHESDSTISIQGEVNEVLKKVDKISVRNLEHKCELLTYEKEILKTLIDFNIPFKDYGIVMPDDSYLMLDLD